MYQELIRNELTEAAGVLQAFLADEQNLKNIEAAAKLLADSFKEEGKVLSCGNGGSHCDAMHFAEELTGRYRENRPGYAGIAISDPSHLSCVSNDFGYDYVFSRYVEAVGRRGDVLLGISTSGNSGNILKAIEAARAKGMKVIALTGKDGGKMAGSAHQGHSHPDPAGRKRDGQVIREGGWGSRGANDRSWRLVSSLSSLIDAKMIN